MAALIFAEQSFHAGELAVQEMMKVGRLDCPTVPRLSSQAAAMLERAPLLALGTLDAQGRPWSTLVGGEPGFSRGLPQLDNHIAIKVGVDGKHDPVIEQLLGTVEEAANSGGMREGLRGKMVSGLAIDLASRKRVKIYGRAVAGALAVAEDDVGRPSAIAQLLVGIEQSLGNCPKYLNCKRIRPAPITSELVSDKLPLPEAAINFLRKADVFFISSSNGDADMDTNHRGGPHGFVRLVSNDESGVKLVWPEYSGNRLYQTLGNLMANPQAGLVFPDFETGNALYLTGRTEILAGAKAAAVIVHSNLAVLLHVESARMVKQSLGFRGEALEMSPYNPTVRPLATERSSVRGQEDGQCPTVRLLRHKIITPSIARFTFAFGEDSPTANRQYKPGQHAALDFSSALDVGYSHMKDDDPRLINDDFIRSFTVTSTPDDKAWTFDITIRKVGRVTDYLFDRAERMIPVEAVLRGFGGDFKVAADPAGKIAFIASGVGITPLYSAGSDLKAEGVALVWTLQVKDLSLASDLFEQHPHLAKSASLYVTGGPGEKGALEALRSEGVSIQERRLEQSDLQLEGISKWYSCTSPQVRKVIQAWLPEVDLLYEDFSY